MIDSENVQCSGPWPTDHHILYMARPKHSQLNSITF